jgi:hypothetical protein
MADSINELITRDDVDRNDPASVADIEAVADLFGTGLPEPMLRVWRATDGIVLTEIDAHILGPSESLEIAREDVLNMGLVDRGLLPLLDDHQSNYLMLNLSAPLAFRVSYVPHDDGSRLIFRDLFSCAKHLLGMMDREESADGLYDTPGDYEADAPRDMADQMSARALLTTGGEHEECNYAAQLLDASNLDEWQQLLETDHFVRRDVRARMAKMSSPAIRELLRTDDKAFADFAARAEAEARKAGLDVGPRDLDCLKIGQSWMNLDAFFHRRNIPNAFSRMIAWFADVAAKRDPRTREDHFMID